MESSYYFDENQLLNGNQYATFYNVCLMNQCDESRPIIQFFSRNARNFFNGIEDKMRKYYYDVFTFGLRVDNYYTPESKVFFDDDFWLISGSCLTLFHAYDFLILWNMTRTSSSPTIKKVIIAGVNTKCNFSMQQFLYHLYLENISYLFLQDINKYYRNNGSICFHKVNVISRRMFGNFGMFFENIKERNSFRDYGYHYLSINPQIHSDIIEIGVIYRDTDRSRDIVNENDMLEMINSLKRVYKNLVIHRFAFDKMNVKEQILAIANKNILISPSGSSLSNILWIVNTKVLVIECFSWFVNGEIMLFTINNGYRYIPMLPTVHYSQIYETFYIEKLFEEKPFVFQHIFKLHPLKWRQITALRIYASIKRVMFSIHYGINYIHQSII